MEQRFPYLYAWDFKKNSAYFVHIDREDLHKSSFLDQRISAKDNTLVTHDIQAALGVSTEKPGEVPVFIFHTAFCCSTLLARSLDMPGKTLVFREPLTLLQLADLKRGFSKAPFEYHRLLMRTMQFLTDLSVCEEKIIIKPTNLANNLITDLIAVYPTTRILLLHDDLEPFIISVLKRPDESVTGMNLFLKRFLADNPADLHFLDAQISGKLHLQAALAWALQKSELNKAMGEQSSQIRTIHTSDFLTRPETILSEASKWLNLDLDKNSFNGITDTPLWGLNAKHPEKRYDVEQRAKEQREFQSRFAPMIEEARTWLTHTAGLMPNPFPIDLRLSPVQDIVNKTP